MATACPTFDALGLRLDGAVARVTLQRPQRLNALTPALMNELIDAARWLGALPELRVVLLHGAGRAFCAGFDLHSMAAARGAMDRDDTDLGRRLLDAWGAIPAITIAAVHGHCVGGGLLLAVSCDLRLAADGTRFSIPELALGIPLGWGGVPRLVRLLGPAVAMELVLDAQPFDAAQALQWRLLSRCVAADELDRAAQAWAQRLAQRPLQALRATKRRFAAAQEALCTLHGSERDADDLLAAYRDPQTLRAMGAYLAARQG